MEKYLIKDIVYQTYDQPIMVLCKTKEECETLVQYYISKFNGEDEPFQEHHYEYPEDMCIHLTKYRWSYADSEYITTSSLCGGSIIIPFSDVVFKDSLRTRGFEVVTKRKNEGVEIILPKRGTSQSMAYDFFSPKKYTVAPGEVAKIWTDVKAYMQNGEGLILNVRSSMGGKFMLANTQGWIEPDYYNNESNEGNIGFFLKNISNEVLTIEKDERIGQGMFIPFLVSDNGNPEEEIKRTGGFGSTGK